MCLFKTLICYHCIKTQLITVKSVPSCRTCKFMLPLSPAWLRQLSWVHVLWGVTRMRITSRNHQWKESGWILEYIDQAETVSCNEGWKPEVLTCHWHEATCQYFHREIFSFLSALFWRLIFSSKCQHFTHIMSIFQPFYSKLHLIQMYVYLLYFSMVAVFSIRNYGKK